jgi:exosortase
MTVSEKSRVTRLVQVLVCALAGAVVFQFWGNATHGYIASNSLFYWWTFQWINPDSQTEHAWLVLALSGFLFWRNLRATGDDAGGGSWAACAALIAGLALHALGFVCQQPRISIVALLLFIWGLFRLWGGKRWGDASMFPLGFMVFAIPVNALDTVGFWLQMWVVRSGELVAHSFGIGVLRSGTQLFSPDGRYKYDVVAACSGIRSLMALGALSLFLGYLWFRPLWLRAAIFLISLPFVYLGNVIRITTIIVAANKGGQAWGDKIHDVMGFGVFAVVLGGVIGVAEMVSRRWPQWNARADTPREATNSIGSPEALKVAIMYSVIAMAVLDAAYLSYRSTLTPEGRPGVTLSADGKNPAELPTYLGSDWMGHRIEPEAIEREILPPDTGFSRKLYLNLERPGERVLLSIVLSGRDRTSIHRPELCLVGQGWTIDRTSTQRFNYPGKEGGGFDATVLSVHRETRGTTSAVTEPEIVAYWFVGDGRVVASQGERMLYDAWTRIAHGRAPRWAYVFLQTGAEGGVARIQTILDSALPSFQPPAGGTG